jgi:hypothetical protein
MPRYSNSFGNFCVSGGTQVLYPDVDGFSVDILNICCSTPPPTVPTCSVLLYGSGGLNAYLQSSNTNIPLGVYNISGPDIAHTTTKLWSSANNQITEYDITLSPWSITFNRTIVMPSGVLLGNGLGAITNTKLISSNSLALPEEIIVLDITTNTAVPVVIGTLGLNRIVDGDILVTTTNKILVTNKDINVNGVYLTQYSYPSGAFEVEVDITSLPTNQYNLFIDNSNLYLIGGNPSPIYNVSLTFPYAQTFVNNSPVSSVRGTSQIASCCNVNLK